MRKSVPFVPLEVVDRVGGLVRLCQHYHDEGCPSFPSVGKLGSTDLHTSGDGFEKQNGTTSVVPLEQRSDYFREATAAPTPASLASFAALSVFSQVKSGSLRPKCP